MEAGTRQLLFTITWVQAHTPLVSKMPTDVHSRQHRILVIQMAQVRLLLRQRMQAAEQATVQSRLEQSPGARHLTHTHLMEAGTRQLLFTITWVQAHTPLVSKMPTDVLSRLRRILVIRMVQLRSP